MKRQRNMSDEQNKRNPNENEEIIINEEKFSQIIRSGLHISLVKTRNIKLRTPS